MASVADAWHTLFVERRLPWRVEHWLEQRPAIQRWRHHRYEQKYVRLVGRFVRPGDLVFDIGANVGEKTAAFLAHRARVICVEPDGRNVSVLGARFGAQPDVEIVAAGAGAHQHHAVFYPSEDPARSTFARDRISALGDGCVFHEGRSIEITTLDNLIARYGLPSFVKVDVEGFEPDVMRGLSRPVPVLSFEFHGELFEDVKICLLDLVRLGMRRFNVLLYPVGGVPPYHPLDRLYLPAPVSSDGLLAVLERLRVHKLAGDIYAFA